VFGAVYALTAIKRVRGMRLVGLERARRRRAKAHQTVVTQQQPRRVLLLDPAREPADHE
jgi:hypothetical protein